MVLRTIWLLLMLWVGDMCVGVLAEMTGLSIYIVLYKVLPVREWLLMMHRRGLLRLTREGLILLETSLQTIEMLDLWMVVLIGGTRMKLIRIILRRCRIKSRLMLSRELKIMLLKVLCVSMGMVLHLIQVQGAFALLPIDVGVQIIERWINHVWSSLTELLVQT